MLINLFCSPKVVNLSNNSLSIPMKIYLHNTLTRTREEFIPIAAPFVGLYVCGPTVYGDPHLGHARSAITFDILFRLLRAANYDVRYIRNITDVGHLEHDADQGEDKIAKLARAKKLEPMEVAQYYTNRYHQFMHLLGNIDPSIEPLASGHIIEQIDLTQQILDRGMAYESNGSIYFDVQKYAQNNDYGILSGRNIDDLQSGGRSDEFQSEKHFSADFALWKKASPEHIMRWPSPWSDGFPGWHCECSAMSRKYLGETFDIHGGGMDLVFPHHECEIAQSRVANGKPSARYWVHNNMITLNGQKMGKSLGNAINLEQFFSGDHPLLERAYAPMVIRFFILQAHYRSTLDFSNEALQAAEKGLERLMKAWDVLEKITPSASTNCDLDLREKCLSAVADDMNTPIAIATLFDFARTINSLYDKSLTINAEDLETLRSHYGDIMSNLLGLESTALAALDTAALDGAMQLIIEMRLRARTDKNWALSDLIRDRLAQTGIALKDRKDGTDWELI